MLLFRAQPIARGGLDDPRCAQHYESDVRDAPKACQARAVKIAIVGTGAIGSTFAFHLAKHGHEVAVVARGKRLEALERERAIVTVAGERAPVHPAAALDPTVVWDLVLVAVLAHQLEPLMPAIRASAAKTVMFMFNTFAPLDPLRDAVGSARFAFGFPAIFASLPDGKLKAKIYTQGQVTTVTDPAWAKVFSEAGIATVVHDDMHSWLRSHAAFVVPMMGLSALVHTRGGRGISWSEARNFTRVWNAGFALVRALGNAVTPSPVVMMTRTPDVVLTAGFWAMSRTQTARELGALGKTELRFLLDAMIAAAPPGSVEALVELRRAQDAA